ncbi:MAG: hypothetical protein M1838_004746 [Thelocarpon superellum]|nr:MAG: hypothetical protein M1838_004746 [Thelocarpon superellum]
MDGVFLPVILPFLSHSPFTVKHENFKTCNQSGFCKRNRAYADAAGALGSSWEAPYSLAPDSVQLENGQLTGIISKTVIPGNELVRLPVTVALLQSGTVRVTVDEERRQKGEIELRHGSQARKERYNEAAKWAIVGGLELDPAAKLGEQTATYTVVHYGPDQSYEAVIRHKPFGVDFKRDGKVHVVFNERNLLNVEHWRAKAEPEIKEGDAATEGGETKPADNESDATLWEESFGGNTDTKPRGPESVAMDITFPDYAHVFGIPEHAGPLSLRETRGGDGNYNEPYRMYNADVFEYEMDSPMTLYGSIPFMQAHRKDSTVAVFWLNAAETWVDIVKSRGSANPLSLGTSGKTDSHTHWMSESGLLDIFVFLGPTPQAITKAYGELTGFTQLPQQFAIAYHQCRWNYVTDEDVRDVDRKMDKLKIPYDVIWLDIEYTDGKKYFTFDSHTFGDPLGMQEQLDQRNRKLVAIIDPHIKNEAGYHVVDELKSKGLGVLNKDGQIYEGWCWPGSSHWVDCFNPAAITWWKGLFKYEAWLGTSSNTFLWNDMNEPSVFNGPETTMPKDNLHHDNWEHRDVHNINGMTFVNATYQALLERKKGVVRRPFVLTRSFYAGSQRMGAMWTGDNQASWDHLAASIPMILSNGIAGFPFAGADVGGFFGNPSKELLTRWYQTGAFYPFFRGHAHIDTRRREPYLAGEPYTSIITQALRLRYQLLPAWYTAFHQASVDGTPIVRPHYYVFPADEAGFAIDDQFYIGATGLLAKPVVTEGAESVDIFIADEEQYFDYSDYTIYSGRGRKTMAAALDKIPLLMQGGHIIPRRDRPRRSSGLMRWDPFTLVVALSKQGTAEGSLYLDDGESFEHEAGAFIHRRFSMDAPAQTLSSTDLKDASITSKQSTAYEASLKGVHVEKILLVGAPSHWSELRTVRVLVEDKTGKTESTAQLEYHPATGSGKATKAAWAIVRAPNVPIASSWEIVFT